ncbi:MAG: crcB, partial [Acidimicrobiales bacterium]|nr:crcB [Acidimicrobiales bacterium]
MKLVLIALAGALGALSRYGVGAAIGVRTFPWATLAINLSGSFVLGALLTAGVRRNWPEGVTVPLGVGFLGAFTTFSTFSYESITLVRTDRAGMAAAYVVASVAGGLAAAALGY